MDKPPKRGSRQRYTFRFTSGSFIPAQELIFNLVPVIEILRDVPARVAQRARDKDRVAEYIP